MENLYLRRPRTIYISINGYKGCGAPIQITDNDYDDINPQINNSGVVTWQGQDGGLDWEIYRASTPINISNTPPYGT